MVNTHLPILRWFQLVFGGHVAGKNVMSRKHRQVFHWTIYGAGARAALTELLVHLREKREQAVLAMRAADTPPEKRQEILVRLSALKLKEYTL